MRDAAYDRAENFFEGLLKSFAQLVAVLALPIEWQTSGDYILFILIFIIPSE